MQILLAYNYSFSRSYFLSWLRYLIYADTVGYPLNALTSEVGLLCPSAERSGIREIAWSVSTSPIDSQRQPIDVEADPKLHRVGYYLYMRNITGEYEGSYYCTVVFHDGSLSHTMSVGCLFVAGNLASYTWSRSKVPKLFPCNEHHLQVAIW